MKKIDGSRLQTGKLVLNDDCLWARQLWRQARATVWEPSAVSLDADRDSWASDQLADAERQLLIDSLAVVSVVAPCIERSSVVLYNLLGNRSCQCYLLQQACQALNHADAVVYCCDEFGIEPATVDEVPRDLAALLAPLARDFQVATAGDLLRILVEDYLRAGVITCSAVLLLFEQQEMTAKLPGVAVLFDHLLRDLARQHEFCCDLVNVIKASNPDAWNVMLQEGSVAAFKECAGTLEVYLQQACFIEGSFDRACQQLHCLVDHTCESIDLPRPFGTYGHPAWMVSAGAVNRRADASCDEVPTTPPPSAVTAKQQEQQ